MYKVILNLQYKFNELKKLKGKTRYNRIATIISERISSMNHYTQVGTQEREKILFFSKMYLKHIEKNVVIC